MSGAGKKLSITSFIILFFLSLLCFIACKKNETTDKPYEFSSLAFTVFADVQLERENFGNTRNAYLALKNHLRYSESVGAEVVFMPGDVVNKADESCYEAFEKAIKEVYGTDETEYPEFIYCMGNHEWWGANEKDTEKAVSLFNAHARIDTDSLVKKSGMKYYLDDSVTLPTYYKVIKGIPFLVVSACDSGGRIEGKLKEEIRGWLEEIGNLPSVKAGGPIFVAYHYPIQGVTYKGESASTFSSAINDLLKNYPNAVLFTGDTHFNAVNERTINQKDYTSINIGSSSYSRNMSLSATNYQYDNVSLYYKDKNLLEGEVGFKCEYTPTLQVVNVDTSGKTTIERFYTADDVNDAKKIGITWEWDLIKSKDDLVYTDERIENVEWAKMLYNKDALTWAEDKKVAYNEENERMIVCFDDVTDHNCAEHYRIEVKAAGNDKNAKYYDFSGNYYKYDSDPHTYRFILEDIPDATGYTVTVTAFDFFDNPSKTSLVATEEDETLAFPDKTDELAVKTYGDISKRINYSVTAEGGNSSVEYYYRGISPYRGGMMICQVISDDSKSVEDALPAVGKNAALTFKVKNPNDFDIYLGLTIITTENKLDRTWDDFSSAHRVKVSAKSDWTTVRIVFGNEYGYNFDPEKITRLSLKAMADISAEDAENGYEMTFYLDDLDIENV